MRRALAWMGILLVWTGCRGCAGPEPPNERLVHQLVDPYTRVSRAGTRLDRAREVLDDVSAQLGYGKVPGDYLARYESQGWAERLIGLLSHGGTMQLEAAWTELRMRVTEGFGIDSETKIRTRQAEARVYNIEHEKPPEATLRSSYLAEIAWVLVLLDRPRGEGSNQAD